MAGAQLDKLIGLLADPDPEALTGLIGILKAGCGFVPIDPRYPDDRVSWILADCACEVLVTRRRHLERAVALARGTARLRQVICLDGEPGDAGTADGVAVHVLEARHPEQEPAGAVGEPRDERELRSVAYVVYTSGSTGRPKGVPVSHENLVPMLAWGAEHLGLGEGTRVLQSLSYCFDFGLFEQLTTVLAGGTLCFPGEAAGDPAAFAREIVRHDANTLHATPAFARELAAGGEALEGLEIVHLGGEALSWGTVGRIREAAPRATVYNGYGPTEATVNSSIFRLDGLEDGGRPVVPIGRRSADNALYVLDRASRPVPFGARGELHVGGIGVARGYLNRPDLTAARFVPDPFGVAPGGRLYCTGDLVRYLPGGDVEFLGRIDQQVKVRGFRVEPGEIEAALCEHPAVREAAVVAHPDPAGDLRLVAYVAAEGAAAPELRAFLAGRLPPHMVPSAFVALASLPLTGSAKVDRRALPAPSFGERAAAGAAPPRTTAEELVAGICAEVLGLDRIGIHDDLFELGCHSLLATKIVARMRETLRVEVPLRSLFDAPTVAGLAAAAGSAAKGEELPKIVPARRDRDLPLSFPQERIWFLHKLEPASVAYNVPRALAVRGRFDVGLLERVFTEIVRRHEILRTTFEERGGEPVQVVHPPWGFTIPLIDLRQWQAPERDAWVARFIVDEGRTPFDLGRGPLIRVKVLQLADDEHVMVTTEHHLVHDGWTQGVLIRDFLALYAVFARGAPSPLPELPLQYADFAVWQRQWLRGELLDRQVAFWRRELAGAPPLSGVPADRPRPRRRSTEGGMVTCTIPVDLANGLRALSRRLGATLFMSLLAAFDVLLWRSGAQDDLPVGTVLANRRVQEIEGLLGMILNTLVLRVKLSGEPGFDALARRVREVCLAAYEHQDAPIEKLVEVLQPARSLSYTPLFQVLFSFLDTPTSDLTLPGLDLRLLDSHNRSAKFDLNVTAIPHAEQRIGGSVNVEGSEIALLWEYSTDLYEPATVERLARHYLRLLAGVAAAPACPISELPLLDAAEQAELLAGRYPAWPAYPRERCVHELVAEQAARRPDAVALVSSAEHLSYGEVERAANRLARRLVRLGVGPDERVGVCLERSPRLIVALLAVLEAGGAYLPLDPSHPRERLAGLLAEGDVRVVVTEERLQGALPPLAPGVRVVALDAEAAALAAESPEPLPARAAAENLAYVLFTSGSTGRPKGVAVPHRAVVRLVRQSVFARLDEDQVLVQTSAVTFDASTLEIWGSLAHGARLAVPPPRVLSLAELGELLEGARATLAFLTSGLFNQMAEAELPRLSSVRQLLTGGEAASAGHFRRVVEHLGDGALIHVYGPTESTTFATCHCLDAASPVGTSVPIGRAIAHTRVHLLDGGLRPVPVGVPGEVWIGGDGLARGYLGRPDLTAERFLPDPLPPEQAGEPGGRLYRTGDLARWLPGGAIDFLGRIDQQVKLRGFRIEPGEIEAALSAHPEVAEAVVAARGEGAHRRLVAYVVPAGGGDPSGLSAGRLRAFLEERLPDYMVPAGFVPVPAIPLTAHGKVDREALLALEEPEARDAAAWQPPRTPVEEVLAGLWAELLKVERVSVVDDFFALGGHSLIATRAVSRLRDLFGLELPLQVLFEARTVAELAAHVEGPLAMDGRPEMAQPPRPTPGEPVLSFAQQRLWFLDQLQPGGSGYNLPGVFRLRGDLAPVPLGRGLSEVVRRHEGLRTVFPTAAGRPLALVRPAAEVPLPVVDLAGLPARRRDAEALRLTAAEARRPFDLAEGPVLRAGLLRLAAAEHVLQLTLHHIAADGWSAGVLTREFAALYGAFSRGEPSPLPPLPLQYGDFARWQRGWLTAEVMAAQLAYWRERLRGAPAALDLPADRPRPAGPTRGGARLPFAVSPELTSELAAAGRREGVTPFMLLLAAFQTLLSRWSDSEDICVGSPVANRRFSELEGLIGFFANTLVLRTDLAGDSDVRGLLRRVRATALGAYAHQDLPFERLVQELAPERDPGRQPLFQVMLAPLDGPLAPDLLGSLTLEPLPTPGGTAKFDLALFADLAPDRPLAGLLEYRPELFDQATAQRLLLHLETLLATSLASPEQRIAELPLLGGEERRQVVLGWNQTRTPYPREATIHGLFEAQAEAAPDAVAIEAGKTTWSYRELNRRANQLAHHLRARGVGPETRVGICLDRSPELIAAVLAILKAGGVYVPLDPAYPAGRLRFMLEDSEVRLVVSREPLALEIPAAIVPVLCLDRHARELARRSGENPRPAGCSDQLAYVIYTSGSTGVPKGVSVTHRGVVRLVRGTGYARFGPAEVFLLLAPTSFDISTFEIWGALLHGARLAVAQDRVPSLDELGETLARHGVTTLWLTAGLFHQMVDLRLAALCGVRQLLAGGDVLSPAHVRRVLEEVPGCTLVNGYGPTENTTFTCCRPLTRPAEAGATVPIGPPIANTRVYLLDRALQPVPVGVPGELYSGGDGLARGYLGRPALTAARFVPDPFAAEAGEPGGRLYRTGDLARWRGDGDIEFLGRTDQQLKIRGFRVEPGEVEAALVQHPQVREAAVVAREIAGARALVAYLVCAESRPTPDELRRHLRERLPEPMLPAAFTVLSELPLSPNGKMDRRVLPEPEWEPGPADQAAPRTPTEEVLAGIWADVLGMEQVGVHDRFFDLGGHSLQATRVASRLRDVFAVELPLRTLFERPSVAALAAAVEEARRGGAGGTAPPLLPVPRDRDLPLSFAQERLWFLDQLEPGSAAYDIPAALALSGPLDLRALAAAYGEILRRHEALRTTFKAVDSRPVQRISPAAEVFVPVVDLAALADEPRQAAAERWTAEEVRRPFDLSRGPLVRLTLLRLGCREHLALLNLHHIVADGWSMGVLIRELAALYTAAVTAAPSPLPELPVQYADYAVWQRGWLRGEVLEEQLGWWRQELAGAPASLHLPGDRPRPPVSSHQGGQVEIGLSAELTAALEARSRQGGATLFMTLLAGWSALLARYTAQEDVLVGSPIANRTRLETEGLIGFFVNVLALRTDLSGDPGFGELVARVRRATLGAFDHQDLPFERLVEELQPERHLARAPLVQVLFALQNAPRPAFELPGLTLARVPLPASDVKLDLSLLLERGAEGISGVLRYAAALFDAATVRRAASHLQALLTGAAADPAAPLSLLPLLREAEAAQVSAEWNDTRRSAAPGTFPQRFALQAARAPAAPAVAFEGEVLTYGELDRRAKRLAHRLRLLGVGPEVMVGVLLDRSAEAIVALLGVIEAGGAYVPLDPAAPAERLAFVAEHSRMALALTRDGLASLLPRGLPALSLAGDLPEAGEWNGEAPAVSEIPGESPVYAIYTSGSTGRPKGVVVEHRQLASYLDGVLERIGLPAGASFATVSTFAADLGNTMIFAALATGGCLHVIAEDRVADGERLAEYFARHPVDCLKIVPSHLAALLACTRPERILPRRLLMLGGEAAPWQEVDLLHRLAPGCRVLNHYGPTETTVGVTTFEPPRGAAARQTATLPLGRPLANSRAYVLGPDMARAPIGVPGELFLGGGNVARGYLAAPALTAERFLPDPFAPQPGARMFRTGDLVRHLADGCLAFLGRIDHQVKIRGFRVEPGEMEAVLLAHPAVAGCAVTARQEPDGERRLAAYVIPAEPCDLSAAALRDFLRERLPAYMLPSAFVFLTAFPLTRNGKVDRNALPAPDRRGTADDAYVAPRNAIEELLAEVWAEVLRVPRVGAEDDFFDLGGHSLLAFELITRIHSALGVQLPVRALFEAPSLAALAAEVADEMARQAGDELLAEAWMQDAAEERPAVRSGDGEAA